MEEHDRAKMPDWDVIRISNHKVEVLYPEVPKDGRKREMTLGRLFNNIKWYRITESQYKVSGLP
jgi:hypothetical protein